MPNRNLHALWHQTHWYAIHTKPRQEALAAAALKRLHLEIFLPRMRKQQWLNGFAQQVIGPLFPSYFFAQFCPAISLDAVRFAHGVLHVVSAGNIPVPLEEQALAAIRTRLEPDGLAHIGPVCFRPGDQVQIEEGPWQGTIGRFEQEWDDGRRVAILLESFHHARLLIERHCLSAVA